MCQMSLLEKEWEFTMCSNKLDQVKKFLEEHPFQEEPQQHFRFVNYRSKINGNTVLHYAAQCVREALIHLLHSKVLHRISF